MLPAIAAHAITAYTQPGDLVLDPMCGIGTTLVEAAHLGRDAAGVDFEGRWSQLAAAADIGLFAHSQGQRRVGPWSYAGTPPHAAPTTDPGGVARPVRVGGHLTPVRTDGARPRRHRPSGDGVHKSRPTATPTGTKTGATSPTPGLVWPHRRVHQILTPRLPRPAPSRRHRGRHRPALAQERRAGRPALGGVRREPPRGRADRGRAVRRPARPGHRHTAATWRAVRSSNATSSAANATAACPCTSSPTKTSSFCSSSSFPEFARPADRVSRSFAVMRHEPRASTPDPTPAPPPSTGRRDPRPRHGPRPPRPGPRRPAGTRSPRTPARRPRPPATPRWPTEDRPTGETGDRQGERKPPAATDRLPLRTPAAGGAAARGAGVLAAPQSRRPGHPVHLPRQTSALLPG